MIAPMQPQVKRKNCHMLPREGRMHA